MRFITDAMLGRLARWLRLLGFDTLYYSDISDSDLLRIARRENRFILTRDTHFLRFKDLKDFLLINSNNTLDQLIEITRVLKMKKFDLARCVKCNGMLDDVVEKADIEGSVPEYIYLKLSKFMRCRACGNIYWEGSHMKSIST
ncbi:MAG: Mut7-C RNAse domain-containing protein [Nitrospirae bacterium]|nr:Mut7-C RNAse domain-containing protein [Nitrospirota bacterium]